MSRIKRHLLAGLMSICLLPGMTTESTPPPAEATLHPLLQVAYQAEPGATAMAAPTARPPGLIGEVTAAGTVPPQLLRVQQGLHPDDEMGQTLLCIGCGKPYTYFNWDTHADAGQYIQAHNAQFEAAGVDFTLYCADGQAEILVDVSRMRMLVELIASEIPGAYKRQYVDNVIIVLSSKTYCLDYDYWTSEQRHSLAGDLDGYFTDEKGLGDIGGCCASFPNSNERVRVIWLPLGALMDEGGVLYEHANCAYSYHMYATEEINVLGRFTHEVIHALSLSRTMPSLEEYGFRANQNWELQWMATGQGIPMLETAEAFAYDLSKVILNRHFPLALFAVTPFDEGEWLQEDFSVAVDLTQDGPVSRYDTSQRETAGAGWQPAPTEMPEAVETQAEEPPVEAAPTPEGISVEEALRQAVEQQAATPQPTALPHYPQRTEAPEETPPVSNSSDDVEEILWLEFEGE